MRVPHVRLSTTPHREVVAMRRATRLLAVVLTLLTVLGGTASTLTALSTFPQEAPVRDGWFSAPVLREADAELKTFGDMVRAYTAEEQIVVEIDCSSENLNLDS